MSIVARKILPVVAGLATAAALSVAVAPSSSADTSGGIGAAATTLSATPALKPALGLTAVHGSITTGTAPQFRYTSARVPKGTVLVLQRQFGTSHAWGTVRRFKVGNGVVTPPKLPTLGRYTYRLALMKGSKYLAYSAARAVYAYGNVSIGVLCNGQTDGYICGTAYAGNIDLVDRTFTYVGRSDGFTGTEPPNWDLIFSFGTNSCRSITVQFATDDISKSNDVDSIQLIQSHLDPQGSSAPVGRVGTMHARMDGSPFSLRANATSGEQVFVNGTASCWTSSGDA